MKTKNEKTGTDLLEHKGATNEIIQIRLNHSKLASLLLYYYIATKHKTINSDHAKCRSVVWHN